MIDIRLIKAGIIAIPIKTIPSIGLLSPNYFVIENQEGREIKQVPNFQTGILEDTVCTIAQYKLSKREILLATSTLEESFIDREIQTIEPIALPYNVLPLIQSYQSIKSNISIINTIFSFFSFRGSLNNLILEIDEDILDEILVQESNQ